MKRNNYLVGQIYPDKNQKYAIEENLRYCRYIYNTLLDRVQKIYERRGETLSLYDMTSIVAQMKHYHRDLKKPDSQALNHSCEELCDDFNRLFLGQGRYPKKKVKEKRESYITNGSIKITGSKVRLPKLGWMDVSFNNPIINVGKIHTVKVTRVDGKYYVSVCYLIETDKSNKRGFARKIKHYFLYAALVLVMCLLIALFVYLR